MATLVLTKTFVNLLSSGQAVGYYTQPFRTQQYDVDGQVRTYGGGRQRSITTFGQKGTYDFTLVSVLPADLAILQSWIGQTVEVRNTKGERYVGVYYQLKVGERFADKEYDVAIELKALTVPDGV